MGMLVVHGAMLKCSYGQGGPVPLAVLRPEVTAGGQPVATVADAEPLVNIPSFGVCVSPTNPEMNPPLVMTPPCVPVVVGGWEPGSPSVLVGELPALTQASSCECSWAGVIQIVDAGQVGTSVS